MAVWPLVNIKGIYGLWRHTVVVQRSLSAIADLYLFENNCHLIPGLSSNDYL